MSWDPKLIFDIGLHKGLEAEFYLRKGFCVVGVEASGDLAEIARNRNRESNETVSFFVKDPSRNK